ncbi:carbon-nitrogen hydrolase family protein [Streptosporangium sp. NPDC006930]|uniref:carbon-nitrogen hydrolase family protein n=1 Tax=unclassified Streptosporangium TaxID=2632669 RepID=UPI003412E358
MVNAALDVQHAACNSEPCSLPHGHQRCTLPGLDTGSGIPIGVAQMSVDRTDVAANVDRVVEILRAGAAAGHRLVVFPECVLTGYLFDSRADTYAAALNVADPRIGRVVDACRESSIHAVVGLLEETDGEVHNSALVIGPSGIIGRYRKQHLPYLGADRFVEQGGGTAPRVVDTPFGRVGVMICFDLRFPESARELALQGADVIAMPTNWPAGSDILADHVTRVRALENLTYLAVADRPDSEAGTPFIGRSQIIAPSGAVLVDAGQEEGLFGAEIDVRKARTKRLIIEPGRFELPVFSGRRPEMYGEITRSVPSGR